MWKEAVVAYLRHCPGRSLKELSKAMNICQKRSLPNRKQSPYDRDIRYYEYKYRQLNTLLCHGTTVAANGLTAFCLLAIHRRIT
jgi:hypothetical protein